MLKHRHCSIANLFEIVMEVKHLLNTLNVDYSDLGVVDPHELTSEQVSVISVQQTLGDAPVDRLIESAKDVKAAIVLIVIKIILQVRGKEVAVA